MEKILPLARSVTIRNEIEYLAKIYKGGWLPKPVGYINGYPLIMYRQATKRYGDNHDQVVYLLVTKEFTWHPKNVMLTLNSYYKKRDRSISNQEKLIEIFGSLKNALEYYRYVNCGNWIVGCFRLATIHARWAGRHVAMAVVMPEYRQQGLAMQIYKLMLEHGHILLSGEMQTKYSQSLWRTLTSYADNNSLYETWAHNISNLKEYKEIDWEDDGVYEKDFEKMLYKRTASKDWRLVLRKKYVSRKTYYKNLPRQI